MPKKNVAPSISGDTDEWYTAGDAAKVLTANSEQEVKPDYMFKLGKLKKIRTKKLSSRVTLYYKPDVDTYRVEPRGVKGGLAKRAGRTGPTVREARKIARGQSEDAA